jgi:hypothetical protein
MVCYGVSSVGCAPILYHETREEERETKTARQRRRDQKWRSKRAVGCNTYTPTCLYAYPYTKHQGMEDSGWRSSWPVGCTPTCIYPCTLCQSQALKEMGSGGGESGGAIGL